MKFLLTLIVAASLCISGLSHGAAITNGDFQTCDFSGWQKDTDGFGDLGATPDFSVINDSGQCSARLYVDDVNTASAEFANTLFTDLDLSASAGEVLTLSFDWRFEGSDGEADIGDYFAVFLGNGTGNSFDAEGALGYLIAPVSTYGTGQFSIDLDAGLYNMLGWTLEFQLGDAFSPTEDILFSSLTIDNVQLKASSILVNAPASLALLLLATVYARRRAIGA
jgi:hypothetical protein